MKLSNILSAAGLASTTLAAFATFTPHTDIQLAVSVPESTASSGSGSMYMQFTAPTSYQWAAFGIGNQMAGSTIFVIYTDGTGNVTLSPRNGLGEFQPRFSSDINQEVTLLEGSGVSNGNMVANIRLTTSSSLINAAGTSTNWISSWRSGSALATTNQQESISMHDAHSQFTLDLSQATQATDTNPFIAAAPAASGSGSATPGATPAATSVSAPIASGNSAGSSGSTITYAADIPMFKKAHGIIMSIVVVVLLPLGALLIRLIGGVWIHAGFQILTLLLLIAGFGLGVHLADETNYLYKNSGQTHTIFGTVLFAFFLIQPVGGLLHHLQYKKIQKRGAFGHGHVWFGRAILILAIVNGGLGLKLAQAENKYKIAYGVVAGVIGVVYIAIATTTALKGGKLIGGKSSESVGSGTGSHQPAMGEYPQGSK